MICFFIDVGSIQNFGMRIKSAVAPGAIKSERKRKGAGGENSTEQTEETSLNKQGRLSIEEAP